MRDFVGKGHGLLGHAQHIDFNYLLGSGLLGIVDANLDPKDRPVYACPGGNCDMNPGRRPANAAARSSFRALVRSRRAGLPQRAR
jgi:hypothetical protein